MATAAPARREGDERPVYPMMLDIVVNVEPRLAGSASEGAMYARDHGHAHGHDEHHEKKSGWRILAFVLIALAVIAAIALGLWWYSGFKNPFDGWAPGATQPAGVCNPCRGPGFTQNPNTCLCTPIVQQNTTMMPPRAAMLPPGARLIGRTCNPCSDPTREVQNPATCVCRGIIRNSGH